jgi:hypothetical protein
MQWQGVSCCVSEFIAEQQLRVLCTYGPYKRDGLHTAPSNETFERWLHARAPRFGVRDIADVERAAGDQGLALREIVDMPANNFTLVFVRG